MNTRTLVFLALLVGVGTVLHVVIPPTLLIKPDMMLAMLFLGIALFPDKKNVLLLGIVTGIITALTTGVPGGQIPNMIDKPITAFLFFALYILLTKKYSKLISLTISSIAGTIVSGTIFLGSLALLFKLPEAFLAMFSLGVLPAAVLNPILLSILFPVVLAILKRTNFTSTVEM